MDNDMMIRGFTEDGDLCRLSDCSSRRIASRSERRRRRCFCCWTLKGRFTTKNTKNTNSRRIVSALCGSVQLVSGQNISLNLSRSCVHTMHVECTILVPHNPWTVPLKLLSLMSSCNLNGFALLASAVRHVRGKHLFVLLHKAEDTEAQFLLILIYKLFIPCLFIRRFLLCSQKNIQTACLTEQKGPKQATG